MGNYASRDGDPALMPLWANIVGKPATFTPAMHGDEAHTPTYVKVTGTPVDNQIGVWTAANTLEGDANLTWDGSSLTFGASHGDKIKLYNGGNEVIGTESFGVLIKQTSNNAGSHIGFWGFGGEQFRMDTLTGDFKATGEITAYA